MQCPKGYQMGSNGVCQQGNGYAAGGLTSRRSRNRNVSRIPGGGNQGGEIIDWAEPYPWITNPEFWNENPPDNRFPCVAQCQQYLPIGQCTSGPSWGTYCDCNCCELSMQPGYNTGTPTFYCDCGGCNWQYWLCVSLCAAALIGASMGGAGGRAGAHGAPPSPGSGAGGSRRRVGGPIRRKPRRMRRR